MKQPIFAVHPDAVARGRMLADMLRQRNGTAKPAEQTRSLGNSMKGEQSEFSPSPRQPPST